VLQLYLPTHHGIIDCHHIEYNSLHNRKYKYVGGYILISQFELINSTSGMELNGHINMVSPKTNRNKIRIPVETNQGTDCIANTNESGLAGTNASSGGVSMEPSLNRLRSGPENENDDYEHVLLKLKDQDFSDWPNKAGVKHFYSRYNCSSLTAHCLVQRIE
jgi:hypothetical protein